MIVVDTSVWIDVLNGNDTGPARRCVELLEDGADVGLTEVVFTEVLQGFRSERQAREVEHHLRAFPVLRFESLDDFALAADLSRAARRSGVTIRKTLDCLIAAPCIRAGAVLLHADVDFDRLATCTPLRVLR